MNIETVSIDSLILDPSNVRRHNDKNLDAIKGSLARFGQTKPIVVNHQNIVIAGNGTLQAAKSLGWDEIKIVRTELMGSEATAYAIADNRTAELATWDDGALGDQLKALEDDGFDLKALGFDSSDMLELGAENTTKEGLTDPDEVPEVEGNTYGVQTGDIWQLGKHRLMCGDSTKAEDVERLMDNKKADMVFTDPPYNLAYGASKNPIWSKKWNGIQKEGVVKNDKHDEDGWINFCSDIASTINKITDGPIYACHAPSPDGMKMTLVFIQCGIHWSSTIILNKSHLVPGRSDYQKKYESCFYGWNEGTKIKHLEDRTQTDVWDYKRSTNNDVHPTMKPLEIMEKAFSHHSHCKTVADIFCGSGSTLIACEKTGRSCYGMEIDPNYCSVIIKRWEDFTGQKAVKL
jgi:DNA modification methylase